MNGQRIRIREVGTCPSCSGTGGGCSEKAGPSMSRWIFVATNEMRRTLG